MSDTYIITTVKPDPLPEGTIVLEHKYPKPYTEYLIPVKKAEEE